MNTKHVCVIGLGQFGLHIARSLARMNCEVVAIDNDERAINAVRDHVQRAVIADARDLDALKSVVASEFDEGIVSVGESLEVSILATLHLKQIGVGRIRAKASSEDHAKILTSIGADETIFPEQETAARMAHRVVHPNMLDFLPIVGDYRVAEINTPEDCAGKSLIELKLRNRFNLFVLAIRDHRGNINFLPPGDTVLLTSDKLVLIGQDTDIQQLAD